jgi:Beta-glucosidase-related glycosidases
MRTRCKQLSVTTTTAHTVSAVDMRGGIFFRIISVAAVSAATACGGHTLRTPVLTAPRVSRDVTSQRGNERFIDSLVSVMTLTEKLGQLSQYSGIAEITGPGAAEANPEMVRSGRVGSFLNVSGASETRRLQKIAVEDTRLHIPLLFGLDVIHGMRTIFPIPLAEASSWNPELIGEASRIAAREAAAYGVNWTFAPMVDIARDPRWGRITEGAGEDPYLASLIAAARVRGFQGADLLSHEAIAATAKHFAAYGGAEGGRDYNVVDVSERTLRELYLPPFHAAACAGVATFMASFNEISGVPSHANRWLLTDVLRGEWGFEGAVVSDWTGVGELLKHGIAADTAEAARRAIEAGVDIEMVSETYSRGLPGLVQRSGISPATIDEAVRRVLRLKQRLGLFHDPYRGMDPAREINDVLTPASRAVARRLAQQSIVLLRNEGNLLPLSTTTRTIAVIGALGNDSASALGAWAGKGRPADAVTVLAGIRKTVSASTRVIYEPGASPMSADTTGFARAVAAARSADVVVLVVGEHRGMSGEAESRSTIDLPGSQLLLAQAIRKTGKPLIAVLMNGRPLAIPWLAENATAIVEAWFLGVEMGNAVADVLFGAVNPSGKLTATFPRAVGQIPIYYNHRPTGRPPSETDKYTSKYNDLPWTPQFPFGFGLSYTHFAYSAPRLSTATIAAGDSLGVDFTVTNTGSRPGEEIAQLYVQDEAASVTRPVSELRRFKRLMLGPGESAVVHFSLGMNDLAFYDAHMKRVAEPGYFRVMTGSNSRDVTSARFRLTTTADVPILVPEACASIN